MTNRHSVVIVGAGIVGAACADALSADGLRVLVVDAAPPGGGATAAGMGHVVVMDDSAAQLALTGYSRRLWDDLAGALPESVEQRVTGTIWIASDDEEMRAVHGKRQVYESHGAEVEVLDEASLHDAEPNIAPGMAGGLLVKQDSVIYPPAAADWLISRAVSRGSSIRIGDRVASIGQGFVTLASGERIEADWIVNAAGIGALGLLAEPIEGSSIRPRKGHLVITDRYPGFCRHQLVELGYLASARSHGTSSVAFNLQPRATGQMLLGSSRQYDRDTAEVERSIVSRMIERAMLYMPSLAGLRAIRSWTGFRAATEDKLPIIGAHPTMPGVLVAAGHEGLGITTSLATGRIVADIIAARPSEIDRAPFAADRWIGGASHG